MTDEAKRCVEKLRNTAESLKKDSMAYFSDEDFILAADLIESLAAELEQVKRERDAAVEDLSAHRPCDACGLYELQGVRCMQCRRYTERPYWQWRGVKEA